MLRFLRYFSFILLANALWAQNGGKDTSAPPVVHVTSRLVFVDVMARDAHGNVIRGLKPQDFKVTEDGKDQNLDYFLEHVPDDAASVQTPSTPVTEFSNVDAVQPSRPLTIVLCDLLDTPNDDQSMARQQMLKFLDSLPAGDRIALFTLTNRLEMVHGTAGSPELKTAAQKMLRPTDRGLDDSKNENLMDAQIGANLAAEFASSGSPSRGGTNGGGGTSAMQHGLEANNNQSYQVRAYSTIDALGKLAKAMNDYPGRKSLYWLAESFPLSVDVVGAPANSDPSGLTAQQFNNDLIQTQSHFSQTSRQEMMTSLNLLASARIAVYPVSVFGLTTEQSVAAVGSATINSQNPGDPRGGFFTLGNLRSEMDDLARITGGVAIVGNNDIAGAMKQNVNDSAAYYTLAYQPTNGSWNGRFRSIHVAATGATNLIYRRGYFATEDGSLGGSTKDLDHAMQPEDEIETALKLHSKVLHAGPASPGLLVESTIDTSDVTFTTSADGHKHAKIFVQLVAFSDADPTLKSVPQTSGTLNIDLDPQKYEFIAQAGIAFRQQLQLKPGSYHVLLGVHDETGEKLGTVDMPLAIPAQ